MSIPTITVENGALFASAPIAPTPTTRKYHQSITIFNFKVENMDEGNHQSIRPLVSHQHLFKQKIQQTSRETLSNRAAREKYRGKHDVMKRTLFNLKHRCRVQHIEEGAYWTLEDIKELMMSPEFPAKLRQAVQEGRPVKLTIVRRNESELLKCTHHSFWKQAVLNKVDTIKELKNDFSSV